MKITQEEINEKLSDHAIWLKSDLCEKKCVDFNGYDLGGVDFSNIDLNYASFNNAILDHAKFNSSNLKNTSFIGASLLCAEFISSTINNSCFDKTNLEETNFYNSTINNTTYDDAKLLYTDFSYTKMRRVKFNNSDLQNVSFVEASLIYVNLKTANNLKDANFDYSGFPFYCGSLGIKTDTRLARQLAYHFCSLECEDEEFIKARNSILEFANKFHQVDHGVRPLEKIIKQND